MHFTPFLGQYHKMFLFAEIICYFYSNKAASPFSVVNDNDRLSGK